MESFKNLQQDSGNATVTLLGTISLQLEAMLEQNRTPAPAVTVSQTPITFAICVNAFWVVSLILILTSALLATMVQQWSRNLNYLQALERSQNDPTRNMRIRSYRFEGIKAFRAETLVKLVPTLLHGAVFCSSQASHSFSFL